MITLTHVIIALTIIVLMHVALDAHYNSNRNRRLSARQSRR